MQQPVPLTSDSGCEPAFSSWQPGVS